MLIWHLSVISGKMSMNEQVLESTLDEGASSMDIRAARTRAMLVNAFDALVSEKPLDSISVSELCARSTVRRATFYRHFDDMNAFIRYYFSTLTDQFMEERAQDEEIDELMSYARHMHLCLLEFVDCNRETFRHVMGSDMLTDTLDMVILQVADGIIARIEKGAARGNLTPVATPRTVGLCYSSWLVHALRWRMLDDDPGSSEELTDEGLALLAALAGTGE